MRLALLTDDWSPTGGVASYLRRIAPALAGAGHSVLVLHDGDTDPEDAVGRVSTRLTVRGIPGAFRDYGRRRNLASIPPVVAALGRFKPDVVHLHACTNLPLQTTILESFSSLKSLHALETCPAGTRFHSATSQCCSVTTGPLCLPRQVYLRCTLSKRPQVIWRQYRRTRRSNVLYRRFPRIVVASEFVRQVAIGDGFAPDRVTVVPYFTTEEPDAGPPTGRTVLFVGRLVREKGVDLLIDGLSTLSGAWRLVVVGDGMRMQELRRLADARGIAARVDFRGWLNGEALAAAYREASVVAVPSRWPEPFGIVGLEALSHGRPVVAFDVGGIPEWLTSGVGGDLVPAGDGMAMARRIEALLDDPAHAAAVAARGRERVRREFSEHGHLEQLVPIYERIHASGR